MSWPTQVGYPIPYELDLNLIKTQALVVGSRLNLKKSSDKRVLPLLLLLMTHKVRLLKKLHISDFNLIKILFEINMLNFCVPKYLVLLGFLKYAKKLLPKRTFSHIYRSIAKPYFRYCSSEC